MTERTQTLSILGFISGSLIYCYSIVAMAETPTCETTIVPATAGYDFKQMTTLDYEIPEDAVINEVQFTRLPIFDESNPRENNALYRFANRFHINTQAARINDLILFSESEVYDERIMEESERLVRDGKYLSDADIRPVRICGNNVDVEVITRDVWSLTPELSYGRSGGSNKYRFGIKETNLFGTGIELGIRRKHDADRDSTEFVYKDRNIRGSRLEGRLGYSNNDDGAEKLAALSLPFYALDSRRAWTVSLEETDRIDTQYFRGDDISEVRRLSSDYLFSYGFSKGLVDGVTKRWTMGYRYQDEIFSQSDELPPPSVFPVNKKLSYPFIEYQSVEDDFITSFNYDDILRTEDLHLGSELTASLGYAADALGSDADRLVMRGDYSATLFYRERDWLSHKASWSGLYNLDTSKAEDVVLSYQLEFFNKQTKHRSFYASLSGNYTHNLNTNQQHFLGGETGARAFDNRFQIGDRSFLLTLEERMYSDIHLFNLIRVGWAIFVDVGRAWEPGVDDGIEDDYLANAGLGIRLAPSKSDVGSVMHIDLSFPLTNKDDPDVDSSQISVSLKKHF